MEYFPVTDDPAVIARLRVREAITPDTLKLAEFAVAELGLTPPDHQEGDPLPDIASIYPPDHPDGVYVWDVHELDDEELGED
ncbi:hypothetical protein [Stackebrandtia albiflava]|uniref:hypothetical protein n=1 Tax=Stackebrandtia albiflava TaxID=406432 RepID=UPI0031E8013A